MDARMITIINRLEKYLADLETTLKHTREILKALAKEARKNGTTQTTQSRLASPARTYLANQQPQRDGNYPRRAWTSYRENDDAD